MEDVTLIKDNTLVSVTNMMDHSVAYKLDNGVRRHFAPHATIKVKAEELRNLSYQPGGVDLLTNFLQVKNKNLAREFGVSDETVEYNWTEQDVINALTTEPIDVLLDALDFGPEGIIQQLQTKAVELEIPDMDKREAIMKKTGFDISSMIKNKHAYDNEDESKEEKKPITRRTTTKKQTTPQRRVQNKGTE